MVTPLHHGRDHHLNNHHGRYTKEKKRKIVQVMVTPIHHARDHHMNPLSRPLQEEKRRKFDPGEVTPLHHARDHGVHHHHGRDKGRDHLQELFSFFLFFPCFLYARDQCPVSSNVLFCFLNVIYKLLCVMVILI